MGVPQGRVQGSYNLKVTLKQRLEGRKVRCVEV